MRASGLRCLIRCVLATLGCALPVFTLLLVACANDQPHTKPSITRVATQQDQPPPTALQIHTRETGHTTPDATTLERKKVYIAPLGTERLSQHEIDYVRASLLAFFDIDVSVLERRALPSWTYYAPRKRYRAEKLLTYLETIRPRDGDRILGLTGVDISTTKDNHPDWGILGLANIDGTVCVLSTFRTHKKSRGRDHARERLGKTAVHEVGHTLGLEHCPNRSCLMQDARGTVLTTDGERDLCPRCRKHLMARGYLRSDAQSPWSEH